MGAENTVDQPICKTNKKVTMVTTTDKEQIVCPFSRWYLEVQYLLIVLVVVIEVKLNIYLKTVYVLIL